MTDLTERAPLLCEAITEAFGERCEDFEPECWCCKAWAELDRLVHEKDEARAILQALLDKASEQEKTLADKWTADLGASVDSKAAGAAAHIINDFGSEISAALLKMEIADSRALKGKT